MALAVLMSGAILAQAALEGFTVLRVVQTTAVLSGLVPYGLFFLIAVAYTAGAATIAGRGALVQQVNAVESVSNVDVVCTDKTGTLTTGRLTSRRRRAGRRLRPRRRARRRSGRWPTAATTRTSPLSRSPRPCPAAPAWTVRDEVPFASSLRWSGVATATPAPGCSARPDALAAAPARTTACGRHRRTHRPWACACWSWPAPTPASGCAMRRDVPRCPALEPVALVTLADELRPEVIETISRFRADGVALKVLSGDDPRTVTALAVRAGLEVGEPVAGAALDGLDDPALDRLVARTTVFGRVTPEQKAAHRRLAAPPGPLRRDDRRRGQRRPRAQGRPRRGGHAQRQRGHPRHRRHRPRRRFLRRAATRPARGPAHHQRHRRVDVRVPRPRRHPGPGDPRGHHARSGLPLLPHPGRPDSAHCRHPDPVPHLLGPGHPHRPASPEQSRPFRHPGRRDHRRVRHRRIRLALQAASPKDSAPAAHRPR